MGNLATGFSKNLCAQNSLELFTSSFFCTTTKTKRCITMILMAMAMAMAMIMPYRRFAIISDGK
jgi:predicted transcriptional regulator